MLNSRLTSLSDVPQRRYRISCDETMETSAWSYLFLEGLFVKRTQNRMKKTMCQPGSWIPNPHIAPFSKKIQLTFKQTRLLSFLIGRLLNLSKYPLYTAQREMRNCKGIFERKKIFFCKGILRECIFSSNLGSLESCVRPKCPSQCAQCRAVWCDQLCLPVTEQDAPVSLDYAGNTYDQVCGKNGESWMVLRVLFPLILSLQSQGCPDRCLS